MSRLLLASSAAPNCPNPCVGVADDQEGNPGPVVIDRTVRGIASGGRCPAPDGSAGELAEVTRSMTDKRPLFGMRPKVEDPIRGEAARHVDDTTLGMTNLGLISFQRHDQAMLKGATAR
jgi:hypothetical protein